jgi:RND family efflux transporter MFP subunit
MKADFASTFATQFATPFATPFASTTRTTATFVRTGTRRAAFGESIPRSIAHERRRDLMRSSMMLPVQILGAAALVVLVLFFLRRTPEDRVLQDTAPLVRITIAEPTPYQFSVTAHGSVSPRTESDLIPQVSGEVLWVSPSLAGGGFFESGDVLARIDQADYRVARETARAAVARAKSEHGRAEKERGRQRSLATRSVASESRIDDAENAFRVAEAVLQQEQARFERAARDLARTDLTAPYRGRVRSEQVDVGQFVTRGAPIARLYAVDYAEIRLPVPDRELAYLDVPLLPPIRDPATEATPVVGSRVLLSAEFAGRDHHWEATLVRTEGELDPRSRMVHLVARVTDPYGLEVSVETERATPLAVGLFVEAEIEGLSVERAFVLPRDALRPGDRVYIVDSEDQIRFRDVEVLRTERENVILGAGLEEGDRVCTSPLEAVIDGMRVRVLNGEEDGEEDGEQSEDKGGLAERPDETDEALQ